MSGLEWRQTGGTSAVQVRVGGSHIMDWDTDAATFYHAPQLPSTTTASVTAADASYVRLYHNSSSNMICFKNSSNVEFCLNETGPQGAQGDTGAQGPIGPQGTSAATGDFVYAYSTQSQGISSANTFQNVTMNVNATINGWTHTAGSADFTCPSTGTYLVNYRCNIQFNAGISLTTVTGSARVTNNGSEVAGSQTSVQFPIQALSTANSICVSAQQMSLTAGDVLRLQAACSSSSASIGLSGLGTQVSAAFSIIRLL